LLDYTSSNPAHLRFLNKTSNEIFSKNHRNSFHQLKSLDLAFEILMIVEEKPEYTQAAQLKKLVEQPTFFRLFLSMTLSS